MTDNLPYEPTWPHRQFWIDPNMDSKDEYTFGGIRWVSPAEGANLISSRTQDGMHAPALDIDFEARLVPSKTPGHYHLYLDKTMKWWRYRLMLKALSIAGIIEPGYYRASVHRKQSFLRWTRATPMN